MNSNSLKMFIVIEFTIPQLVNTIFHTYTYNKFGINLLGQDIKHDVQNT